MVATPSSKPGALSYRTIDDLLRLEPGTASTENFLVVVVRAREVPGTSIQRGDRLIIARNSRLATGGLLLCRRKRSFELCVMRVDAFGQASLASADPELLPWPPDNALVVGSVVAAVRREGDRSAVAFPPGYGFAPRSVAEQSRARRLNGSELAELRTEVLELEKEAMEVGDAHSSEAKLLRSGAARLQALSRCLEVVHDQRLYTAIVEQIDATLLRLRRVLANRPRWARLRTRLKPLRDPERTSN